MRTREESDETEDLAFERLYRSYRDRIWRFAARMLRDPNEAEDVTQEVFEVVHGSLPSFEGRSTVLTWMTGIARFRALRRCRRHDPVLMGPGTLEGFAGRDGGPSPEERADASLQLERCLSLAESELSEDQRRIFRLHYGENASIPSIARALGRSRAAVKASLWRSRHTLAGRLALPPRASEG